MRGCKGTMHIPNCIARYTLNRLPVWFRADTCRQTGDHYLHGPARKPTQTREEDLPLLQLFIKCANKPKLNLTLKSIGKDRITPFRPGFLLALSRGTQHSDVGLELQSIDRYTELSLCVRQRSQQSNPPCKHWPFFCWKDVRHVDKMNVAITSH